MVVGKGGIDLRQGKMPELIGDLFRRQPPFISNHNTVHRDASPGENWTAAPDLGVAHDQRTNIVDDSHGLYLQTKLTIPRGIVPVLGKELRLFILGRPGVFERHDDFSSGRDSTPPRPEPSPPHTSSSAPSPAPAAPRRRGRARPGPGAGRRSRGRPGSGGPGRWLRAA